MNLPKDPMLLLSVVNTKLRDQYTSLDALCEDMQADREKMETKLQNIDYAYDENTNQFVQKKGNNMSNHMKYNIDLMQTPPEEDTAPASLFSGGPEYGAAEGA